MEFFISLVSIAFFLAGVAVLGFFGHRKALADADAAAVPADFATFLPQWFKQHLVAVIVGVLVTFLTGGVGSFFVLAICAWLWLKPKGAEKVTYSKEEDLKKKADDAAAQWLQSLGSSHAARVPVIDALFTERSQTLEVCHYCTWQYAGVDDRWKDAYYWTTVSRSLAAMDNKEREFLRIAELLNSSADGKDPLYRGWRFALVWSQGKGTSGASQWNLGSVSNESKNPRQALDYAIERLNFSVDNVITKILSHLAELKGKPDLPTGIRDLVQDASDQLIGGGSKVRRGGPRMAAEDMSNAPRARKGERSGGRDGGRDGDRRKPGERPRRSRRPCLWSQTSAGQIPPRQPRRPPPCPRPRSTLRLG